MFLLVVISCIKLFVNFQRSTSDFQFKEQQSIHEQNNLDGMWQIKGSAEVIFCEAEANGRQGGHCRSLFFTIKPAKHSFR